MPDQTTTNGSSLAAIKLAVGQAAFAWRSYPSQRRAIGRFPSGPPILVTGTHRSGTTWVANMLMAPGLWTVHEPTNTLHGLWDENFTYAGPGELPPKMERLWDDALAGRVRRLTMNGLADRRWYPLRLLPQPIRRVLVKDPIACLAAGAIVRRFAMGSLVLFRHPAGFVSSLGRLGWPAAVVVDRMRKDDALVRDHLSDVVDLLERAAAGDSTFARAVLAGVLNRVLWRQVQSLQSDPTVTQPVEVRRFEDLCRDPIVEFRRLHEVFALPYDDRTRRRHAGLCGLDGSNASDDPQDYATHSVRRDSAAMADSWRRQLDAAEVNEIRGVWDRFGVPFYDADEDWNDAPSDAATAATASSPDRSPVLQAGRE